MMRPGAKYEKQNPAEDTEMPDSGNPAPFPACLLRLINKSCSFQKGMEKTLAVAPFVGKHPSLSSPPDFSLCEIGGPLQSSVPINLHYVILEDKYSMC